MLYLEVQPTEVWCFLDHSKDRAERWSFDEVLAGEHDGYVENLFGRDALAALKKEVRLRQR